MSSWQDPEFRREYHRQRYLKNKEEVKRRRVERYWEDVEYSRQKQREYGQNGKYKKYNTTERRDAWKKRYYQALSEAKEQLGGKCVKCGTTEGLQFDHIHPKDKSFAITRQLLMSDRKKFQEELDKCQLLCCDCHLEKTKQSWLNGEFK